MFTKMQVLENISGTLLDDFLAAGWYRMQHTIFTTHVLRREDVPLNAIWLRNRLDLWETPSSYIKLQKRNKKFRLEIAKAQPFLEAHKNLFSAYRRVTFGDRQASLDHYLFDVNGFHPYDSYQVDCYDGEELIGCGIFDMGSVSAAGIVSFFDRQYDAHSIGRYLIYAMIEYCKSIGLHYFYPGYVVPGDPAFDYKLNFGPDTIEFYRISTQEWLPWKEKDEHEDYIGQLIAQLQKIQEGLANVGVQSEVVQYRFFELATHLFWGDAVLDHPYYLRTALSEDPEKEIIMIYDLLQDEIHTMEIEHLPDCYDETTQPITYNSLILAPKKEQE